MVDEEVEYEYDVCLSFAGEQRSYVEAVANDLRSRGLRPFYDDYEQVQLWGKDLYEHLDWIYRKAARYCVIFASAEYAAKVWTSHERRSAQARAIEASAEYILPVRFDDTEVPGIRPTVGYIDGSRVQPIELGEMILKKVGVNPRRNFIPPRADRLYKVLNAKTKVVKNAIDESTWNFFRALQRMSEAERKLVFRTFLLACTEDLPKNVHTSMDLIRRDTEFMPAQMIEMYNGMTSLGFSAKQRKDHGGNVSDNLIVVTWQDRHVIEPAAAYHFVSRYSTEIAYRMIELSIGARCEAHGEEWADRLDFSDLSAATSVK